MDPVTIEDAMARFAEEYPELIEAMNVFGMTSAEYDRAMRALSPSLVRVGSSTQA